MDFGFLFMIFSVASVFVNVYFYQEDQFCLKNKQIEQHINVIMESDHLDNVDLSVTGPSLDSNELATSTTVKQAFIDSTTSDLQSPGGHYGPLDVNFTLFTFMPVKITTKTTHTHDFLVNLEDIEHNQHLKLHSNVNLSSRQSSSSSSSGIKSSINYLITAFIDLNQLKAIATVTISVIGILVVIFIIKWLFRRCYYTGVSTGPTRLSSAPTQPLQPQHQIQLSCKHPHQQIRIGPAKSKRSATGTFNGMAFTIDVYGQQQELFSNGKEGDVPNDTAGIKSKYVVDGVTVKYVFNKRCNKTIVNKNVKLNYDVNQSMNLNENKSKNGNIVQETRAKWSSWGVVMVIVHHGARFLLLFFLLSKKTFIYFFSCSYFYFKNYFKLL